MSRSGVLICLLIACGCSRSSTNEVVPVSSDPTGPDWFADVTAQVGVNFRHHAGPTGEYFMPQIMGSGVALLDVDNDGRLDILLLNNGGPDSTARHCLYKQQQDGTFRDASVGSGLDVAGYGMGVAVGDFDNDGHVDVYISQYGGGRLFHNKGDGTFEDVTAAAGVALPNWGTSVAFLDFDRDGWLDLIVVNYLAYDPSHACVQASGRADFCHPQQFSGTAARLFHNKGRVNGRWAGYEDVTASAGLAAARSNGLGVACADFDGDGWVDIFIANDARPNHLWINRHNGTFAEEAAIRAIAFNGSGNVEANMGVAIGDFAGSGRLDVFVTHLAEEHHTLWRQDMPGRFRDATAAAGLAEPHWRGTGFGTAAVDFDHDGYLDLAVANGRVTRARLPGRDLASLDLPEFWQPYVERNQLFAGSADGRFRDVSLASPSLTSPPGLYRGMAWGDLDGDGAVDLVVTSIEGPAKVLKNIAPKQGHWFGVRAFDPALKRDALGAVVTLSASGHKRIAMANPGQSYCSSGDPRAHFGLGAVTTIDEILIAWPDGTQEVFPGGPVDRYVTLNRGEGRKAGR